MIPRLKAPALRSLQVPVHWLSPTVSQSNFSMSRKILISSGMAMAGWVSFSWMATWKKRF